MNSLWRKTQHYYIDAAINCLESHKKAACRDTFDSCGYKIEQAITLLQQAHELEKQHDPSRSKLRRSHSHL